MARRDLLEAQGDELKLSATNWRSRSRRHPAEVEGEGRVIIPDRIFNDIVRSLSGGEVHLEHDDSAGMVRLAAGENDVPYQGFRGRDYPHFPNS